MSFYLCGPQGLFSAEILRDLLIFLPEISLELVKREKKLKVKCNLAKDFTKFSHRKFIISHQFGLNEIFSLMIF